jgi:autotransporter-associated beta strand protein
VALVFPASPRPASTNNITGLTVTSIQFTAPGSGSDGNAITLAGDTTITATNTAGSNTLRLDLNQQPVFIGPVAHFNHVYNVAGGGLLYVFGKITGHPTLNGVHKQGAGRLVLNTSNDYGGPTVIDGGEYSGVGGGIPITSAVTMAAGTTFDIGAPLFAKIGSLAGAGSVRGGGSLYTGYDNTSTTFSGIISGSTTLLKEGNGTFTLSGANSYSGQTWVDAGTLQVGTDFAIPAASAVILRAGSTLDLQFWGDRIGSLSGVGNVINHAGLLWTGGDNTSTGFSGVMSGNSGRLVKEGNGVFTLAGANTYTGFTVISGGTLRIGTELAIPASNAVAMTTGTTFDLNNFNSTLGSLAGRGSVTLGSGSLTTGGNNSSTEFNGVISGNGGKLVKQGSGIFTLHGDHTYTGSTTVSAGTLRVTAGTLLNSPITVQSGATLGGGQRHGRAPYGPAGRHGETRGRGSTYSRKSGCNFQPGLDLPGAPQRHRQRVRSTKRQRHGRPYRRSLLAGLPQLCLRHRRYLYDPH